MNRDEIFSHIDHTLPSRLMPTWPEIEQLCAEAERYGAASVCIPPSFVARARQHYPQLKICTSDRFPSGI